MRSEQSNEGRKFTFEFNRAEAKLLGLILSMEAVGDRVEGGIVAGLNQGLEITDPYWGSARTMKDALRLIDDVLLGLPKTAEVKTARQDIEECLSEHEEEEGGYGQ